MKGYNEEETTRGARRSGIVFGIIMVLVYLAVGILFLCNFFNFGVEWINITVGIILIVYGVWRGFRLYKGWN